MKKSFFKFLHVFLMIAMIAWTFGPSLGILVNTASAEETAYAQTDFAAFDGVNIGTNSYTSSSGITATYDSGTGTVDSPVLLKLTGNAPIVTPWFNHAWTIYNYVAIGIRLPATGFIGTQVTGGTAVYQADVMRYDDPTNFPNGYYTVGYGSIPLATGGAALGYLDYEFAANSSNTKKDGLVKLKVIWNADSAPEYFTIDINGLQLDTPTHKFISTFDQLKTALADVNVATIDITKDISGITEELIVGHAVTINGGSHTLSFTSALNALADGHRDGIFVSANGTTINNLSVVMAGTPNHWDGVYGIQFYGVTGGVVNNYTGTGADAALLVNGSAVELTGVTTVSGNEFGGIEVSKGTPPNASELTVTGTLVNGTEAYGLPTIWLVNGQGTVTGANVPATTRTTVKAGQTQYYLIATNVTTINVPANYSTISAAVTAANSGDTINVAAGTYTEQISVGDQYHLTMHLTFKGNNAGISAGATPGDRNAETILIGGFKLWGGSSVIDGFTIQNGFNNGHYDGVVVGSANGGSPNVIIKNNIIKEVTGNQAQGIEVAGGSNNLLIQDNKIVNNNRGIYLNPADGVQIMGNLIDANNGGGNVGIGSSGQSNMTVTDNIISNNSAEGWGMDNVGATVVARGNSFIGNTVSVAWYPYPDTGNKIDATNNWWGSEVLATVQSKVNDSSKVTVTPYYTTNSVDNSGALNGALSDVATVTSTYTVSAGGTTNETIQNVSFGTTKADFLSALTKGDVNQTWNNAVTDPVLTGDTLVVTSLDTSKIVTYTVTVNVNPDIATVATAKSSIDSASYLNLQVTDTTNQDQKTAAVQTVVNTAKNDSTVTATVTFDTNHYDVVISKGVVNDSSIITATFSQSDADAVDALATAKTNAHTALTDALDTYTEANYTTENWATLTGYKTTGDGAIENATNTGAVATAKDNAINGMAGVLKNTQTTPDNSGDVNLSGETSEVVITNSTHEVNILVGSGTDATIDISSLPSFSDNGSNITATLPAINIDSTVADVVIPATTITGPDGWNGVIAAPTVTTVTLPVTNGETKTLSSAIELGFADAKLSFSNAVRILLPNQAGKRAGYSRPGTTFTEITNTCIEDSQTWADGVTGLSADSECKKDVGSDMVIWTRHFTTFASYTQTTNPVVSTGGGGGYAQTTCTDVTYSEWGTVIFNGLQYRTVLSQTPNSCSLSASQIAAESRPYVASVEPVSSQITPVSETPQTSTPTQQVLGVKVYADGTLLKGTNNKIYVVKGNALQYISSLKELAKYKGPILRVTDETIASFATTAVLGEKKYADGTLLRGTDNRIYVFIGGKLQYIPTLKELAKYKGAILKISDSEIASFAKTVVLGAKKYADGTLLRGTDKKVYVLVNGQKQHIRSLQELAKYARKPILDVEDSVVSQY